VKVLELGLHALGVGDEVEPLACPPPAMFSPVGVQAGRTKPPTWLGIGGTCEPPLHGPQESGPAFEARRAGCGTQLVALTEPRPTLNTQTA
jgi:hypothetical protein